MTAFCRLEAVDSSGNSGLHYAAGYGRRELLEYLLKVGFRRLVSELGFRAVEGLGMFRGGVSPAGYVFRGGPGLQREVAGEVWGVPRPLRL